MHAHAHESTFINNLSIYCSYNIYINMNLWKSSHYLSCKICKILKMFGPKYISLSLIANLPNPCRLELLICFLTTCRSLQDRDWAPMHCLGNRTLYRASLSTAPSLRHAASPNVPERSSPSSSLPTMPLARRRLLERVDPPWPSPPELRAPCN
jgi:hypothetical protein